MLSRPVLRSTILAAPREAVIETTSKHQFASNARSLSIKSHPTLALALHRPATTTLLRYASTASGPPYDHINTKREDKISHKELKQHPERVSEDSTVRHVFREEGVEEDEKSPDMMKGVKADLVSFTTNQLNPKASN